MQKVNFSININAPRERVWETLWDDYSYRKWTRVFSEGSYAETDWKEGSKVLFLDGKGSGMVSKIETSKPPEFLSIQHLGIVKDRVEDTESEEVKKWAGAFENYLLKENGGTTTLTVEMDMTEEYKSYFMDTWPRALEELKAIAETKP